MVSTIWDGRPEVNNEKLRCDPLYSIKKLCAIMSGEIANPLNPG
jgi:hypothetical protein